MMSCIEEYLKSFISWKINGTSKNYVFSSVCPVGTKIINFISCLLFCVLCVIINTINIVLAENYSPGAVRLAINASI